MTSEASPSFRLRRKRASSRSKSAPSSFRTSSADCPTCTRITFFTGISNPKIFFKRGPTKDQSPKFATLAFHARQIRRWTHSVGPLIIWLHRYSRKNNTMERLIYGHSASFFTPCFLAMSLSRASTCNQKSYRNAKEASTWPKENLK